MGVGAVRVDGAVGDMALSSRQQSMWKRAEKQAMNQGHDSTGDRLHDCVPCLLAILARFGAGIGLRSLMTVIKMTNECALAQQAHSRYTYR